jgi:hypothetical protein
MSQPYCYWSVADGHYAAMMERCVASARSAGVFKEFHVFTDTQIEGCECYDCQSVADTHGMFKLLYLKAGISQLLFDNFVWIDADTLFRRNPWGILSLLERSPIHVPLMPFKQADRQGANSAPAASRYAELLIKAGVHNPVFDCNAAFWIVRRAAIDRVHDLALHFLGLAKQAGYTATQDEALGYAMQMLCANPAKHLRKSRAEVWGQGAAHGSETVTTGGPAILHLGREQPPVLEPQAIETMDIL